MTTIIEMFIDPFLSAVLDSISNGIVVSEKRLEILDVRILKQQKMSPFIAERLVDNP